MLANRPSLNRLSPPPSVPIHDDPARSSWKHATRLLASPSRTRQLVIRPFLNRLTPPSVAIQMAPARSSYKFPTQLCAKPSFVVKSVQLPPRKRHRPPEAVPTQMFPS